MKSEENINHPLHYSDSKFECIDVMEDWSTKEEFEGYLKNNVFKYVKRYKLKNGVEDLKKARWYLNKLIEFLE